jgi:hypothetical protein
MLADLNSATSGTVSIILDRIELFGNPRTDRTFDPWKCFKLNVR